MDASDFHSKVRRSSRTSRKKILKDFVSSDNRLSYSRKMNENIEIDIPEPPPKVLQSVTSTCSPASEDSDNENQHTNNQVKSHLNFKHNNDTESGGNENENTLSDKKPLKITGALNLEKDIFNEMELNKETEQNTNTLDYCFDLPLEDQLFVDAELYDTKKPPIKTYQRRGVRRMSFNNIRTYGSRRNSIAKEAACQIPGIDISAPDDVKKDHLSSNLLARLKKEVVKDHLATNVPSLSCIKKEFVEDPVSSDLSSPLVCIKKEVVEDPLSPNIPTKSSTKREAKYSSIGHKNSSSPGKLPNVNFVDVDEVKENVHNGAIHCEAVLASPLKNNITFGEESAMIKDDAIDVKAMLPVEMQVLANEEENPLVVGPHLAPKYFPGDVLWGRVSYKSVYWPCVVLLDNDFSHFKFTGTYSMGHTYFVRFFADKGRSSWITSSNLMLFEGLEKFKELKVANSQLISLLNRKIPDVPTLLEKAISEADSMLPFSNGERIRAFYAWFPALDPEFSSVENVELEVTEEYQPPTPVQQKKMKHLQFRIRYVTPKSKKKSFSKPPISTNSKISDSKEGKNHSRKEKSSSDAKAVKKENGVEDTRYSKKKKSEGDIDLLCPPKKKLKMSFNSPNIGLTGVKSNSGAFCQSYSSVFKDAELAAGDSESAMQPAGNAALIDKKTPLDHAQALLKYNHLMTKCRNEKLCFSCHEASSEKLGKAKLCKAGCWQYYHASCGKFKVVDGMEMCNTCRNNKHVCFICKLRKIPEDPQKMSTPSAPGHDTGLQNNSENHGNNAKYVLNCEEALHVKKGGLVLCSVKRCGHYFHVACVGKLPQTLIQGDTLTCPMHTCHTCVCDNPQVSRLHVSKEKLISCLLCPTTYHTGDFCIPSGSHLLTMSQLICPKHKDNTAHTEGLRKSTNCNWCFLCTKGGQLLCCEGCPATVHTTCLEENNIPIADPYYCEDCLSGRFPLYGEVVWVKHASFRWWPAIVKFPDEAPASIHNLPHKDGEYVVQFFGSNDYTWTNNHRTFTFNGDDKDEKFNLKSKQMTKQFSIGVEEARKAHTAYVAQKTARDAELLPMMRPPLYTKIKINKILTTMKMQSEAVEACDCDPNQEHPCRDSCINKDLNAECNPSKCEAGIKCENQKFTKREYPLLRVFSTKDRGWGLETLVDLEADQFVIEYVGEVIDEAEFQLRVKRKVENRDVNYYFLAMNQFYIDAGPRGNPARFMNHSCNPNCNAQKWNVKGETRVGLFTNKEVKAGTELTFDYNFELLGSSKQKCFCSSENCSGFIGVKSKPLKVEIEKLDKMKPAKGKKKSVVKGENGKEADMNEKQAAASKKKPVKDQYGLKLVSPSASSSKKKKQMKRKFHDELCFKCEEPGGLSVCEVDGCIKTYHETCIPLDAKPSKSSISGPHFKCPWHFCRICHVTAEFQCFRCDIGYCRNHSCLVSTSKTGLSCPSHE